MTLRNGVDDEQGRRWENLPQELLWDIIKRVEETETCWPARVLLSCASVCKSWRAITKEIVKTPELSGRLTFPISLKQPGPRDSPVQCYIKRNRATSTYFLYLGPEPSENKNDKLLLAAKRKQRIRNIKYVISLATDDFHRTSKAYVGKVRSNFLENKFTIYDRRPPQQHEQAAAEGVVQPNNSQLNHRFHSNKVSPRRYKVGTIEYKINMIHKCRFHRIKGPRRMNCTIMMMKMNSLTMLEPLKLESKDAIWDEECQYWHLNFRHYGILASDNFQLVSADDDEEHEQEQEKVILEFAKIGEDVYIMDYCYPISAFQAFAICLSNFDAKPTCE